MCERNKICCGEYLAAVINQPRNYFGNQKRGNPCSAIMPQQTCEFGFSCCLPTCCPHPSLCVQRRQPEPQMICYNPCACPIRCRCAGECCPLTYCSPPFMPPFV